MQTKYASHQKEKISFHTSLFLWTLKHPYQMLQKKGHFNTPKSYFIILPHYFTIFRLSDVLSLNFIH